MLRTQEGITDSSSINAKSSLGKTHKGSETIIGHSFTALEMDNSFWHQDINLNRY